MIAKITDITGVCLEGKWKGWLFNKHPDGQWVSIRKLDETDPMEGNPLASLFASAAPTPAPKEPVETYTICGGCGATKPEDRCLGCLHNFGGGSWDTDNVLTPAPSVNVVPSELCQLTFAVQHNPNCPSPWLVRLPGKGPIDMLPYGDPLHLVKHQTGDILGFGKSFDEAARAALKSEGSADEV